MNDPKRGRHVAAFMEPEGGALASALAMGPMVKRQAPVPGMAEESNSPQKLFAIVPDAVEKHQRGVRTRRRDNPARQALTVDGVAG
jgi:hypothetical protein